jgi:hypothetical protein
MFTSLHTEFGVLETTTFLKKERKKSSLESGFQSPFSFRVRFSFWAANLKIAEQALK